MIVSIQITSHFFMKRNYSGSLTQLFSGMHKIAINNTNNNKSGFPLLTNTTSSRLTLSPLSSPSVYSRFWLIPNPLFI